MSWLNPITLNYNNEVYMIVREENRAGNFTIMSNTCPQNIKLSSKAKGVMWYLLTLPDNWIISITEVTNHFTDGISAIRSAFKELEKAGYIEKALRKRRENGCMEHGDYIAYEKPQLIEPKKVIEKTEVKQGDLFQDDEKSSDEKPNTVEPCTENQTLLNTNIIKTNNTNKETIIINDNLKEIELLQNQILKLNKQLNQNSEIDIEKNNTIPDRDTLESLFVSIAQLKATEFTKTLDPLKLKLQFQLFEGYWIPKWDRSRKKANPEKAIENWLLNSFTRLITYNNFNTKPATENYDDANIEVTLD